MTGPAPDLFWPFGELQPQAYRLILCDPPWSFQNWSAKGEKKNPNQHYPCMTLAEIQALPVSLLADPTGCALVLWATSPLLDAAMDTLKGWKFAFKGAGAWGKRSSTGRKWAFGPGYIQRSTAEFWLIGTIGKPERRSRSVRNFIEAPVREHSRKPEQMREDCERLWRGPYAELFARSRREGWASWGLETDRFEPA